MITPMGPGRLIRVSKSGEKPQSTTYIVCEVDKAKAIAIILDGVGVNSGDDIHDLGRVSEELLKAMSLGPGQFMPIDGIKHVSQQQQQQPQPISKKQT